MIVLKWVGDGKNIIPIFPPRDLTKKDLEQRLSRVGNCNTIDELKKQLVGTGLYKTVKRQNKQAVKDGNN